MLANPCSIVRFTPDGRPGGTAPCPLPSPFLRRATSVGCTEMVLLQQRNNIILSYWCLHVFNSCFDKINYLIILAYSCHKNARTHARTHARMHARTHAYILLYNVPRKESLAGSHHEGDEPRRRPHFGEIGSKRHYRLLQLR